MNDHIQTVLNRIAAGTHTTADLVTLGYALQTNEITLATGKRAIAVGGSIGDAVVISGDGNVVIALHGPDVVGFQAALNEALMQLSLDPTSEHALLAQMARLIERLDSYQSLFASAFGDWQERLALNRTEQIRRAIFDFSDQIADKTSGFVGRTFIFDQVEKLISKYRRGYIRIMGDPGIGKSALAAQMVKQKGYCHHFNVAAMGLNNAIFFRKNLVAQLIAYYVLDETLWSDNPDQILFDRVLRQAAQRAAERNQKVILLVDALDEAENDSRMNTLGLPPNLPDGVFFVTTERERDPRVWISVDPEQWSEAISINPSSAQNMDDIEAFLNQSLSKPGVRVYLDRHCTSETDFVKILKDKSGGNFMYLRYTIGDIEYGTYDDDRPNYLPQGLQEYYASHYRRMREHSGDDWKEYKLPIIYAIARNRYPITLDMILAYASLVDPNETEQAKKRAIAIDVLTEWGAFVRRSTIQGDTGPVIGYSFYHESFREFLRSRMGINIEEARIYGQVGQSMKHDLTKKIFGEI